MSDAGLFRGVVSGERRRSHEEVDGNAGRIAAGLRALGVGVGDCVCFLMRNDLAFVEAAFGVARIGAYGVPLNWHFKPEELAYILEDSRASVLIGHADLLNALADFIPEPIMVLSVSPPPEVLAAYRLDPQLLKTPPSATSFDAFVAEHAPSEVPSQPQPLTMIYTSGTTGHPKGVRRNASTPREAEVAEQRRAMFGLRPGTRMLVPGPLYHSAPNSFGLGAARLGGALVLMPRFEPEKFLKLIEEFRIDAVFMVPTMFIRLLKLPPEVRARYDLSSLKHVIHAAAPCPSDVKRAVIEWWGPVINEFYGSTESSAVTFATSNDALAKPGTVGQLVPGAEMKFLDDNGRELPRGEIGEIYTRLHLNPDFTYQNKPEKRAEIEREGFITSGDVGYMDLDGYVFICDRKRDMVISGGVNIYPAEIEAALHALAGVHDCAVFGVPDSDFGEALMAVVEPLPGVALNVEAIRDGLRKVLAGYKVPKRIEIQYDLPREDSGKIFKRRLRDPFWAAAGRKI